MTNTHLPPNWKGRLLGLINSSRELDAETLRLLDAWAQAEGGTARWNPLNTTQPLMGSTSYNSSSVQDYSKPIVGIAATAITLANGRYNGLLGALQAGSATAIDTVNLYRTEFQTWGTSSDLILSVLRG